MSSQQENGNCTKRQQENGNCTKSWQLTKKSKKRHLFVFGRSTHCNIKQRNRKAKPKGQKQIKISKQHKQTQR